MCSGRPDMLEGLQLSTNPKDYFWVSQGVTKVDGMDDKEEFDLTDVSITYVLNLLRSLHPQLWAP